MDDERENDQEVAAGYLVSLSGRAWGLALGMIFGLGLFAATNVLWLKGGQQVGKHLGLLGEYFPLYDVSFVGSLVGFVYAFVIGYVTGRVICFVYNRTSRA